VNGQFTRHNNGLLWTMSGHALKAIPGFCREYLSSIWLKGQGLNEAEDHPVYGEYLP
jgi:hypothetical protein